MGPGLNAPSSNPSISDSCLARSTRRCLTACSVHGLGRWVCFASLLCPCGGTATCFAVIALLAGWDEVLWWLAR